MQLHFISEHYTVVLALLRAALSLILKYSTEGTVQDRVSPDLNSSSKVPVGEEVASSRDTILYMVLFKKFLQVKKNAHWRQRSRT